VACDGWLGGLVPAWAVRQWRSWKEALALAMQLG
jgi:hypothetical protein